MCLALKIALHVCLEIVVALCSHSHSHTNDRVHGHRALLITATNYPMYLHLSHDDTTHLASQWGREPTGEGIRAFFAVARKFRVVNVGTTTCIGKQRQEKRMHETCGDGWYELSNSPGPRQIPYLGPCCIARHLLHGTHPPLVGSRPWRVHTSIAHSPSSHHDTHTHTTTPQTITPLTTVVHPGRTDRHSCSVTLKAGARVHGTNARHP